MRRHRQSFHRSKRKIRCASCAGPPGSARFHQNYRTDLPALRLSHLPAAAARASLSALFRVLRRTVLFCREEQVELSAVQHLSVINSGGDDRRFETYPLLIRADRPEAAVLLPQTEICQQGKLTPVIIPHLSPGQVSEPSLVPAVSQPYIQRILSLSEERAHIIGLILHPVPVIREIRRQILIADLPAVEVSLVETEADDIET